MRRQSGQSFRPAGGKGAKKGSETEVTVYTEKGIEMSREARQDDGENGVRSSLDEVPRARRKHFAERRRQWRSALLSI